MKTVTISRNGYSTNNLVRRRPTESELLELHSGTVLERLIENRGGQKMGRRRLLLILFRGSVTLPCRAIVAGRNTRVCSQRMCIFGFYQGNKKNVKGLIMTG